MIEIIFFCIIPTLLISIAWAIGIDRMMNEHRDYKGEDFLNNYDELSKLAENTSFDNREQLKSKQ